MTPLEYDEWALEKILKQSTPKMSPIAQEMMKAKAPTTAPSSIAADELKRKEEAALAQLKADLQAAQSQYYYIGSGAAQQQQQTANTQSYQQWYTNGLAAQQAPKPQVTTYPMTPNTPQPKPEEVVPDDAFWTELHEEFMDFSYRLCGYRYIKASKEMYAYGYILPKELAFQYGQAQLAKVIEVATLDLQAALYSDEYWKFRRVPGNYIQFERLPDDIIAVGRIDGD